MRISDWSSDVCSSDLFVYVWSSLLHANVGGNFNRLGHWIATPRFHHWHHGLEREAFDVNFAIHFPWIDKLFGTFHLPKDRWPENYGIPEDVPRSEEHTSELQSLMRISYAVFCLKKKKYTQTHINTTLNQHTKTIQ